MKMFNFYYKCECGHKHRGRGYYDIIQLSQDIEELIIRGNGRVYYVVIVQCSLGCFLCIPGWNVASPFHVESIDQLKNYLTQSMDEMGVSIITYGLKKYYGIKK